PAQVPRGLEQVRFGDVRGVDELVPGLDVPPPRVVLHDPPDDAALGVEHRQAAADLGGEREQVQLRAQPAVVAPLGLGQQAQVLLLRLTRLPRGAVDPLQLRVLLTPPPVRPAGPHQLERRDVAGGGHVRPPAQVLPAHLPGTGVEVVVDGQLGPADLHRLLDADLARRRVQRPLPAAALEPDQLQLVRLTGQLGPRLLLADHPAREPLPLPDDRAHPRLDPLQILRAERVRHAEVVVEPVLDRRAPAPPGARGHGPPPPAPTTAPAECRRPPGPPPLPPPPAPPPPPPASGAARSRTPPLPRPAITGLSAAAPPVPFGMKRVSPVVPASTTCSRP